MNIPVYNSTHSKKVFLSHSKAWEHFFLKLTEYEILKISKYCENITMIQRRVQRSSQKLHIPSPKSKRNYDSQKRDSKDSINQPERLISNFCQKQKLTITQQQFSNIFFFGIHHFKKIKVNMQEIKSLKRKGKPYPPISIQRQLFLYS